MIGLEYILELNNITLTDLSRELNITRANFYNWIKGVRRMPDKYIEILSERFNMPKEYFTQELTEIDKIKIQKIKLMNELKPVEYPDVKVDEDTGEGNEVVSVHYNQDELLELDIIDYQIEEAEFYSTIKETLDKCFNRHNGMITDEINDARELLKIYKTFADLMNYDSADKSTIRGVLKILEIYYKGGTIHNPFEDPLIDGIVTALKKRDEWLKEDWGHK